MGKHRKNSAVTAADLGTMTDAQLLAKFGPTSKRTRKTIVETDRRLKQPPRLRRGEGKK
jgi:hypothetical protein